jgi:hypothetical protein
MSRRRKNALKRRRRAAPAEPAAPRLTLVPPPAPRAAEEALDPGRDAWPMLPTPERRRSAATPWAGVLHNHRRLIYAFAATLVGVVVLLILRWIEAGERMRPFVGPPPGG